MVLQSARRIFLGSLTCFALTGCSVLSSLDTASQPLTTYELTPLPASSGAARRGPQLEVALPTATDALASDRIVIKPSPLEVQSLPDARWVNDTNEYVQLLLVRSLSNSGRFSLVTGEGAGPPPDLVMLTDLQAFQARVVTGQVSVVIEMTVTLVRDTDGRVLSSRNFATALPVLDSSAPAVIAGFDQAMTQQLGELVDWLSVVPGV